MNKFESSPIVKEFRKQVADNLPQKDICVVAGVSGGPDSMTLLYLLHRFEIRTIAVHCNYQLRGENSDKDQELVEHMSLLWGNECAAVRLNPESSDAGNFQNWARSRRYQIFKDLKEEYNADYIATAHHEDDQIETILQKILRGAGTAAWKGMEVTEQDIFRPLLEVRKSDIMTFVQDFNIPYRIDSSNEESTYARNFLRHNWFPIFNKFFPGWRENLLKIPNRAKEFEGLADEVLASVRLNSKALHRHKFLNLPEHVQRPVFFRFFELNDTNASLSAAALSEIKQLETLQTGKSLQLTDTVFVKRDREKFVLLVKSDIKKQTESVTVKQAELEPGRQIGSLLLQSRSGVAEFDESTLNIDLDKIKFPIVVREWKNGDTIQPIGMKGSQLISDHLTNRKIRSTKKNLAKVIETFDGIICAVIFPHKLKDNQIGTLAEPLKCTSETKKILTIRKL